MCATPINESGFFSDNYSRKILFESELAIDLILYIVNLWIQLQLKWFGQQPFTTSIEWKHSINIYLCT